MPHGIHTHKPENYDNNVIGKRGAEVAIDALPFDNRFPA
jgi:hypothetical protein